ncbi:MAG: type II secretion system protein, partial [Candidatus Anammoximicrobium sp.]|nr:type II secretion system protein [Candidatus Anammoximicrobium sp.]
MTTNQPRRPRGFTLVEMLVVIAIIGVLAAILVPTLYRVVVKARENRIAQELNQLHLAIESYKQKYGDYPPDFTTLMSLNDFETSAGTHLIVRHIRKAFPRHTYTLGTTGTLAAIFKDSDGNLVAPDPSEALVLWLSQVREDPRQPLSGTDKRVVLFPFDEKRLVDLDGDGLLSYLPPDCTMPYVYFDSRIYTDPTPIPSTTTP